MQMAAGTSSGPPTARGAQVLDKRAASDTTERLEESRCPKRHRVQESSDAMLENSPNCEDESSTSTSQENEQELPAGLIVQQQETNGAPQMRELEREEEQPEADTNDGGGGRHSESNDEDLGGPEEGPAGEEEGDLQGGDAAVGVGGAQGVEDLDAAAILSAAEQSRAFTAVDTHQPFEGYEDEPPLVPARLENIRIAQEYVEDIRCATLENGRLDSASIEKLRNPTPPEQLADLGLLHLELYLALSDAPERIYNGVKEVLDRRLPHLEIPSLFVMRGKVDRLTGISSILDDMCINGCHAFTGPRFSLLDACSVCGELRYEQKVLQATGKKVGRKHMTTIPLGPQIQALRQSVSGAKAMRYRNQQTKELLEEMQGYTSPRDHVYQDIFSGIDYLKLYQTSQLTEDDTLVNFSMDGAQLYQNKKSDTWIAIWIVQDYDPKTRFKRKHVLPALIVPGPKKPKNLDSYTYRSMHHLSAIQREDGGHGIKCWDGEKGMVISSRTALYLNMADTVGLIGVDGRVPHHGARGCRVACDMLGRHKPGQGHYYAVHLQPFNYGDVPECNHGDVDTENIKSATIEQYHIDLALVEASANLAEYEQNRYRTGISKRSIISGLVKELTLPPPKSFSVDLMHLFWINLGELMVPLFRGKLKCENTDDIKSWDWAVLQGPNWTNFGKLVANSTVHFPSSLERPPRNPAEKINSKYKATEYFLLLFGLGPGLLRFFLPRSYWRHFCKLVRSVRILTQQRISYDQLVDARHFAIQFVEEYEVLYYQRRVDQMHFCRPVLHTLLHVPLETKRVGPGAYYTQFKNERAIGDFGKEIRQPSNPFGNLAQIAVQQARKNALKVIYPDLDSKKQLP
ncbi:hypothetical protein H1R20_g13850, partial [Candolleomyces eurysporus]